MSKKNIKLEILQPSEIGPREKMAISESPVWKRTLFSDTKSAIKSLIFGLFSNFKKFCSTHCEPHPTG